MEKIPLPTESDSNLKCGILIPNYMRIFSIADIKHRKKILKYIKCIELR